MSALVLIHTLEQGNMELQLVNFEQAKALKELGFPTKWTYNKNVPNTFQLGDTMHGFTYHYYPTLELAAKWLRLKKKVNIDIVTVEDNETAHRMGIDVIYQINIFYSVYDEHGQEFRHAYYIDTPLDELIKSYEKESDNWSDEQWKFYDNELENHKYFTDYEEALSAGITKVIEILKNN